MPVHSKDHFYLQHNKRVGEIIFTCADHAFTCACRSEQYREEVRALRAALDQARNATGMARGGGGVGGTVKRGTNRSGACFRGYGIVPKITMDGLYIRATSRASISRRSPSPFSLYIYTL